MKLNRVGFTLTLAFLIGCSSAEVSVPTGMKVSGLSAAVVQKDAPAANAFASLSAMATQGALSGASFGVYSVSAPTAVTDRLAARSTALGMPAKAAVAKDDLMHLSTAQNGSWSLTLNDLSEGEEYVDSSRNHLGASVAEANLAPDDQFVNTGRTYANRTFGDAFTALSPYAYRLWKYFNAHSWGQGTQVEGVYQLTAAFNTTVDGLPVIGPGGKVAVDMTTDGAVIRHEGSLRHANALLHVVQGNKDLVTPQAAEATVNARLDARGIDRKQFQVSRREFGYFMYGRKSIQTVLVPYYAFFLEPVPGVMSKIVVEVEPATNDPAVLAMIAADQQAEIARKAPLTAKPDTRVR